MLIFAILSGGMYVIGAVVWAFAWLIRLEDCRDRAARRHALRMVWCTPVWPAIAVPILGRWLRETWREAWGPDPDQPTPAKPAELKRTRRSKASKRKFENYPKGDPA